MDISVLGRGIKPTCIPPTSCTRARVKLPALFHPAWQPYAAWILVSACRCQSELPPILPLGGGPRVEAGRWGVHRARTRTAGSGGLFDRPKMGPEYSETRSPVRALDFTCGTDSHPSIPLVRIGYHALLGDVDPHSAECLTALGEPHADRPALIGPLRHLKLCQACRVGEDSR
ncbi:hypothetical protein IMZ48_16025 [Candidatus Bathyarchaeota archaeon]|nr:hypothetical protein [Candidatus Bathyarchaeota archaeon]